MAPETPIRYTVGHLGVTGHDSHIVRRGDLGFYVGPHPSSDLAKGGWHLTDAVLPDGTRLQCPVQTSMFEAQ